jgi:hypothetical protein
MDTENTNSVTEATNPASANGDPFLQAFGFGETADSNTAGNNEAIQDDHPEDDVKPDTAKKTDTGRDYPIRYKGKDEVLHLTDDQLTAMLQKGRDYDEVRKQRDDLNAKAADYDALNRMADYLASNNGMSRKEYMEYIDSQTTENGIRAKIAEEHPDLDEDVVGKLVELEVSKLTAAKEAAIEEETAKDMAALKAEYPDADINALPADVTAAIESGMKPVEAMRMNELRELRKAKAELDTQIAALKKEKDNAFRSAGRAESKAADIAADPFLKGFMGGG